MFKFKQFSIKSVIKKGNMRMNLKKLKKAILSTLVICVFSVMTVFAATYTIADPILSETSTKTTVYTKMDIAMNATPDACLALNITPRYSLRGSSILYADTTKGISSYSGRVTQLKGSVNYTNQVDSHKKYISYSQVGSVLISGSYSTVATNSGNFN